MHKPQCITQEPDSLIPPDMDGLLHVGVGPLGPASCFGFAPLVCANQHPLLPSCITNSSRLEHVRQPGAYQLELASSTFYFVPLPLGIGDVDLVYSCTYIWRTFWRTKGRSRARISGMRLFVYSPFRETVPEFFFFFSFCEPGTRRLLVVAQHKFSSPPYERISGRLDSIDQKIRTTVHQMRALQYFVLLSKPP